MRVFSTMPQDCQLNGILAKRVGVQNAPGNLGMPRHCYLGMGKPVEFVAAPGLGIMGPWAHGIFSGAGLEKSHGGHEILSRPNL